MMHMFISLIILEYAGATYPYKRGHHHPKCGPRTAIWSASESLTWWEVGNLCEKELSGAGFCGVLVPSPTEHVTTLGQTKEQALGNVRHEVVSYLMDSTNGNRYQLQEMIMRCNKAGIRVFAQIVLRSMASGRYSGFGSAMSFFNSSKSFYPAVPYYYYDFEPLNNCSCHDGSVNSSTLFTCTEGDARPLILQKALARVVSFLNELVDYGLAGIFLRDADLMDPKVIREIVDQVKPLNVHHGFEDGDKLFVTAMVTRNDKGRIVVEKEIRSYGRVLQLEKSATLVGKLAQSLSSGLLTLQVIRNLTNCDLQCYRDELLVVDWDSKDSYGSSSNALARAVLLATYPGLILVRTLGTVDQFLYGLITFRNAVKGTNASSVSTEGSWSSISFGPEGTFVTSVSSASREVAKSFQTDLKPGSYINILRPTEKFSVDDKGKTSFSSGESKSKAVLICAGCNGTSFDWGKMKHEPEELLAVTVLLPGKTLSIMITTAVILAVCCLVLLVATVKAQTYYPLLAQHDEVFTLMPPVLIMLILHAVYLGLATSETTVLIGPAPVPSNSWDRSAMSNTTILIEAKLDQDPSIHALVFIRGGSGCRFDRTKICTVSVQGLQQGHTEVYQAYNLRAEGISQLSMQELANMSNSSEGATTLGIPTVLTTNDIADPHFHALNKYGPNYYLAKVSMNCTETWNGWFEFAMLRVELHGNTTIVKTAAPKEERRTCSGQRFYEPHYRSANFHGLCGHVNVFHASGECVITQETSDLYHRRAK